MADATITFGADPGNVPATVEQLKQITDELFKGIPLGAEKAKAAQDELIKSWQTLGVTVLQANDAAATLRPQFEQLGQKGSNAAEIMKGLRGELFGVYSTTQLVTSNLRDLQAGLAPLIADVEKFAENAGASRQALDLFSNSTEMLIRPTTIAKNLIENFRIAWDAFKEGAGLSTDATVKFGEEMDRVAKQLDKMREATAKESQELADRASAVAIQVNAERSRGEVTEATRKAVADLIEEYDKGDLSIPPKLMRAAALVGVLTEAQEDAAEAAEKAGKAAEKAADKQEKAAEKANKKIQEALDKRAASLAAETAELEKQFSAESQLIPKLMEFADGKKAGTAAVDDSIRALKEELSVLEQSAKAAQDAADAAQKNLEDAQKREKELADKPVLTLDETEEQAKLKGELNDLDAEAATKAEDAAQATFEYGAAQSELADSTADASDAIGDQNKQTDYAASVMAELEAATKGYDKAISDAGQSTQSTTAYVEAIGEDGKKFWTNFTDTVVEGNQAIEDTGSAIGDVSKALPGAADGLYDVAGALDEVDRAQGEGEKEKGLAKVGADAEKLAKEYLPEILRLVKEIGEEASKVTLGGGSGGGL